jgi:hypothetical protein
MRYRIKELLTFGSYALMGWLVWQWWHGWLSWQLTTTCLVIAALHLCVLGINLRERLEVFADYISRMTILVPMWVGIAFSALGWLFARSFQLKLAASGVLLVFALVYLIYRGVRAHYQKVGHGILPVGPRGPVWMNPSPKAARDGDIGIYDGFVGEELHNAGGHGGVVLQDYSAGQKYLFTSLMETGAIIQKLEDVSTGTYFFLRPIEDLTRVQKLLGLPEAQEMVEQCNGWRVRRHAFINQLFDRLPFNSSKFMTGLRQKWLNKCTGYDWFGLLFGRVPFDHWICIVAAEEHSRRRGIKTARSGAGFFGGFGNPRNPIFKIADRYYRLVDEQDQREFEAAEAAEAERTVQL